MITGQLNTAGKRLAFFAAILTLAAIVGIFIVAPPWSVGSEIIATYEDAKTGTGANAWRVDKHCADSLLPESTFAQEFWAVSAGSEQPPKGTVNWIEYTDEMQALQSRLTRTEENYYILNAELTQAQSRLGVKARYCVQDGCARAIDVNNLQKIVDTCLTPAVARTVVSWQIEANPENAGTPKVGLYVFSAFFAFFLLLSIGYERTIRPLTSWIKTGKFRP